MIEQVCRKERQYGMKIREIAETKRKAKEWFASYTADYDMEDPSKQCIPIMWQNYVRRSLRVWH